MAETRNVDIAEMLRDAQLGDLRMLADDPEADSLRPQETLMAMGLVRDGRGTIGRAPVARNIDIAEVLRDAQLGDLRMLAEERMGYDALHSATEALFDLLDARGVEYVLVGGLAVLQYVKGRNTRDIDLTLSPANLDQLPQLEVSSRDGDFARAHFEGVEVDVLLTSNKVFDMVRAKYAAVQNFGGRDIHCATPEGLVLMQLFALPSLYRQGDFGRVGIYEHDVANLIQQVGVQPERLIPDIRAEVLPTDYEQMRAIIGELRERLVRFEDRRES